jgi:alpha-tubulin suppressor-like RCC1 family protein
LDSEEDPTSKKKIKDMSLKTVACGKNHLGLISKKGELYMMGANDSGQLGVVDLSGMRGCEEPILITSLLYKGLLVDKIACGHSHTIAVVSTG